MTSATHRRERFAMDGKVDEAEGTVEQAIEDLREKGKELVDMVKDRLHR